MIWQILLTILVGVGILFSFLKGVEAARAAVRDYKRPILRKFVQEGIFFASIFFLLGISGLINITVVWGFSAF